MHLRFSNGCIGNCETDTGGNIRESVHLWSLKMKIPLNLKWQCLRPPSGHFCRMGVLKEQKILERTDMDHFTKHDR